MRLITIPISHYCDKARWALELAGIPYTEDAHLQMLHWRHVRRAGGGKTVPVLCTPEGPLSSSHAILRFADKHSGGRLFVNPEAATLETTFDEYGVDTRRWTYFHFLRLPHLVRRYNGMGAPAWERAALNLTFPLARNILRRHLDVSAKTAALSEERIAQTLQSVSERLKDGRPFLLGDELSAADITFAAMTAPLILPNNYGVPLPQAAELPAAMRNQIEDYRAQPAGRFALRLYEQHRSP